MATHYKTVTSSMSKHGRWNSTVNNFVLEFVLFRYTFFRKLKRFKFIWARAVGDYFFMGLHLKLEYFFLPDTFYNFRKIWISKRTSKIKCFSWTGTSKYFLEISPKFFGLLRKYEGFVISWHCNVRIPCNYFENDKDNFFYYWCYKVWIDKAINKRFNTSIRWQTQWLMQEIGES